MVPTVRSEENWMEERTGAGMDLLTNSTEWGTPLTCPRTAEDKSELLAEDESLHSIPRAGQGSAS